MLKIFIATTLALSSLSAVGQTVAQVKCMSGGDTARETFDGELIVSSITDLPNGGFTVVGRRIVKSEVNSPSQTQLCRDWYIHMSTWIDSDNNYSYTYEKRSRSWNTLKISKQGASVRMSCGVGSVVTEYDSIDSYLNEYRQKVVEKQAPRAGQSNTSHNYVGGLNSVSEANCVISEL
jgi:hypothetical protein